MELLSKELQRLQDQVREWRGVPEIELEAAFGRFYQKGGGDQSGPPRFLSGVDLQTFLRVASRLQAKQLQPIPQESYLTISLADEAIRFRLVGDTVVSQYCRDNKIAGKAFTAMIKDRNMSQAQFKLSNTDIPEYDMRVKLRREVPLSHNDDLVLKALANWDSKEKYFRLIRRWTFPVKGAKIELSMVRSTQRMRNGMAAVRSFQDQDLLNVEPSYEIEVELDHDGFPLQTTTVDDAFKGLLNSIGDVLRGIQNSPMLIRKSVKLAALRSYQAITGIRERKFRGNKPKTLLFKNFLEKAETGVPNIREFYNVTDKADGLRVLGLVDESGELFMIDMSFNVYKTNLRNPACKNSLVDGEYVTQNKAGKFIQRFLLFDMYIAPGSKHVDMKSFSGDDGRYAELQDWIRLWNADGGPEKLIRNVGLVVGVKTFFFASKDEPKSIFEGARKMLTLADLSEYNTDGLIFTANEKPLPSTPGTAFAEQFKWKPAKDNSIDFLVTFEKQEDDPTEDKITDGIHAGTKESVRFKTLGLFVGSSEDLAQTDPDPRKTLLFKEPLPTSSADGNKYRPVRFTPIEFPDTLASTCYVRTHHDEQTHEEVIRTEAGEVIREKSIVEMRYDPRQPAGWRWIPMRLRADKMEKFAKGILSGTLNSSTVADDVWDSIHQPITRHMIITGDEAPSAEERREFLGDTDEVEKTAKVLQRKYYERNKSEDQTKVEGMRLFHRLYIKEQILFKAVFAGKPGKKLLDLAVGEAQDLPRWLSGKPSFVLGVDYAGESILKPKSGAYSRLLSRIVQNKARRDEVIIPPIFFVIGDSTKRLIDGTAGNEEIDRVMLRSMFGNPLASDVPPPLVQEMAVNKLARGADSVLCMFSLHYFFNNLETFNGILRNISETLAIGGYFIGCNFDGETLFNFLRDKKQGESVKGMDQSSLLWEITKQYDADELPTDDSAFGMAVDVEFISIGAKHREYLIPFELLKKKMATVGCELVPADELKAIGLQSSTNMFDASFQMAKRDKALARKFEMSDVVKQYSFMNRWYIFKRTSQGTGEIGRLVGLEDEESAEVSAAPGERIPEEGSEGKAELAALGAATGASATATEFMASVTPGGLAAAQQMEARLALATAKRNVEAAKQLDAEAVSMGAKPGADPTAAPGTVARQFIEQQRALAGPQATVPVHRAADVADKDRVYAANDLFKIGEDIGTRKNPYLKLPVKYEAWAARYMAPSARFHIRDTTDPGDTTVYPTILHFLAGMKFKYASKQKDLAKTLFSDKGLHQSFLDQRAELALRARNKKLSEADDWDLLMKEIREVKLKEQQSIRDARVGFDAGLWLSKENDLLRAAVQQRLDGDTRFCAITAAALEQRKKIVYESADDKNLGAEVKKGKIQGDNRYGETIQDLASKIPQERLRACLNS
jgi:hypothetical protein